MNWQDMALCADLPTGEIDRLFFPGFTSFNQTIGETRSVCARCPVWSECRSEVDELETSASIDHTFGIRAGESPAQRLARRAQEAAHV